MDDRRLAELLRALRRRRGWRQRDLAARAGVSQQLVSELEQGRIDHRDLRTARRVAAALDARLELTLHWRGPEAADLLDAGHASLVEGLVERIGRLGWSPLVEWSFSRYGERGAVDLV